MSEAGMVFVMMMCGSPFCYICIFVYGDKYGVIFNQRKSKQKKILRC